MTLKVVMPATVSEAYKPLAFLSYNLVRLATRRSHMRSVRMTLPWRVRVGGWVVMIISAMVSAP